MPQTIKDIDLTKISVYSSDEIDTKLSSLSTTTSDDIEELSTNVANNYTTLASNQTLSGNKTFTGTTTATTLNATNTTVSDTTNTNNLTVTGTATFTNPIQGTALNAYWADIVEYNAGDDDYPYGTLVQFGGEEEFTIATTMVNAVVSDVTKASVVINTGNQFKHPLPLTLIGRVLVKVDTTVSKYDKLYLSKSNKGCASNIENGECFGRALQDSENGYVLANVQANYRN